MGWGFVLIVALQTVAILSITLAWYVMVSPEYRTATPVRTLAAILLSGDAINAVTPSAVVGGELVRVSLLRRFVPTATAAGSTTLTAMARFSAQTLFILSGVPFVLGLTADRGLRNGLLVLSAVLCFLLGLILGLAWSPGGLGMLLRWLDRLGWWRSLRKKREDGWRSLADATVGSLRRRPGDFLLAVGLHYIGWVIGIVEARLVLSLLLAPVSWRQAFAIESLSVAIEGILFFVPAKMGTQEGGKYVIFAALGLDPAKGFALGFVRRLRELAWAAVGLAIYGWFQRHPAPNAASDPQTQLEPAGNRPGA